MNTNYNILKSHFISNCNQNINDLEIKKVKLYFEKQINSPRTLSKIKSISKLIAVLEKRDFLDETNVQVLKEIALLLNNNEYVQIISEYEKNFNKAPTFRLNNMSPQNTFSIPNMYNVQNKNIKEPIFNMNSSLSELNLNDLINTNLLSKEKSNSSESKNNSSNAILSGLSWTLSLLLIKGYFLGHKLFAISLGIDSEQEKLDKCFEVISQEIGHSWKDMTRNLGIREGEIDRIEEKYPRDLRSCCREVFNIIKKKNPRRFRSELEKALRKSRRNDLALQIAEIFDDY